MKNIILLFLFLIPVFLFAQYPTTGNKARLGYQTTGDGLIWRGVAADTAIKPRTTANAYFQLDTVNRVLRRYIATQGSWQVVGGGTNVDSLIYATRYWVNSNFFPLEGGTLTGTGGAGFLGLIAQSGTPSTPASGFKMYANGAHNLAILDRNGWITTFDISAIANRDFTYPSVGGTFALGTGTADRSARWSATNTLAAGNFTDNGTKVQSLLPFQFQSYTTAGLPTGVTGYHIYNTTTNGPAWYQGSRWAYGLESTFNRGTSGYFPRFDANGQIIDSEARVSSTNMIIALTGGLQIPSGTSAQQASTGAGYLRWNTSLGYPTIFNGSSTQSVLIGPFTGYASGEVMYGAASGGMPTSTANFKWDITNSRLLVGAGAPGGPGSTKLVVQQSTANAFIADFRQTSVSAFGPFAIMKLTRTDNTVGYGGTFAFYFNNASSVEQDYARFGAYIESNTTGSHSGGLAFYTTNLGTSTLEKMRISSIGRLGLNTTSPTHRLHVNGRARIDTTDATPTSILGIDGNNVLGKATLGWGLSMAGGALSTTYPYRLIREDTTISEVRIAKTGGSTNMYLRLGDANSQFTRLILRGEDASYPAGTIYAETTGGVLYSHGFEVDNISVVGGTAKSNVKYIYDDGVGTSFFHEANSLILDTYRKVEYRKGRVRTAENYAFRALFSTADTSNTYTSLYNINDNSNTSKYFTKRLFDLTVSGYNTYFYVNKRGDMVLNDSLNRNFSVISGTVKASTYGTGTKEAADLSKTQSNYIAGFATDGTVLDYSISNLPNGIYTGSGTLASTITRPLISPNNKLLFTQKYNSNADSAFIHFYNVDQITGNRSVAIGLTDTVHTNGIAFIRAEKDEVNDKMQVTISSVDQDGTSIIELAGNSTSLTATDFVVTSAAEIRLNDGEVSMNQYGVGDMEAGDLSQTQSNYIAGFSITGRVLDLERKRDTTIYIDDSDYDFSAAVTTAQIARRYNRVIFWMTTTGAAGSDSEITLHTPDVNLMQVEYLIHSVDEAGGFSNVIRFGTNNAVDSTNGLVSSYFPAAGDGVHIRAGLRSSVYKYRYSN